jgi:hypothetical protein
MSGERVLAAMSPVVDRFHSLVIANRKVWSVRAHGASLPHPISDRSSNATGYHRAESTSQVVQIMGAAMKSKPPHGEHSAVLWISRISRHSETLATQPSAA